MVPKTLIFCKDDSHAEDVVHLVREVFGRGNDFAKKITYNARHPVTGQPANTETLIQEFRTSPPLRIAVTVDMIATGTDIKPLECLLFLRDVRSRVYFEQMKGRGTRVLTPTDLQAVSGEDARSKTHFVIVDAVGVCESDKSDSRPLEKMAPYANPSECRSIGSIEDEIPVIRQTNQNSDGAAGGPGNCFAGNPVGETVCYLEDVGIKAAPTGLTVAAIAAVNGLASLTTTSTVQLIMASTQAKIGIAALVAASVTTPIVLQHLANQRLKEEVAVLRQQTAETENLRDEGERLRAQAQSSESQRAKEQTELTRLRGELAALKARGTKAEAVNKVKTSTKAESKTADAAQASTGKFLLAKEMTNVGFADPASAYQTLQWAKINGDTNVIFNALAWGDERTRAEVEAVFAGAPEAVRAKYASADEFMLHLSDRSKPHEDRDILVSSRILRENDVSGEEAALQVEYNWADGSTTTGPMTFVRIGNDWRQALNFDPPAVGKMNSGLQAEGAALANQPASK